MAERARDVFYNTEFRNILANVPLGDLLGLFQVGREKRGERERERVCVCVRVRVSTRET